MIIEGEIDSQDGLTWRYCRDWNGISFRVGEPRADGTWITMSVPIDRKGEIPDFRPGAKVRVTVEVLP